MITPIPFHKAHITEDEIQEVSETIRSGWLTMGPKTIAFEKAFNAYVGSEHAVACHSATAALHLSLKAIGIAKGDEVIVPTNTFVSTAEVVTYFGAVPVLCDSDEGTHCLDATKIEALITEKTKVIIPVHFSGIACDMETIHRVAKKHSLWVIEDAAHALPTRYKGEMVGRLSDFTCFSFYATKTLAAGEGGMITTKHGDLVETLQQNRLHGMNKNAWNRYGEKGAWFYDVVDNGYKYNMSDMNAALGLVQLKKLEWMHSEREKIARRYHQAFEGTQVEVLKVPEFSDSSWHLYVIKVGNRDELIDTLKSQGIACSVHFIPIHLHQYYRETFGYQAENYPVAGRHFDRSLSLPIYPDLSEAQVDFIIEQVLKYAR